MTAFLTLLDALSELECSIDELVLRGFALSRFAFAYRFITLFLLWRLLVFPKFFSSRDRGFRIVGFIAEIERIAHQVVIFGIVNLVALSVYAENAVEEPAYQRDIATREAVMRQTRLGGARTPSSDKLFLAEHFKVRFRRVVTTVTRLRNRDGCFVFVSVRNRPIPFENPICLTASEMRSHGI